MRLVLLSLLTIAGTTATRSSAQSPTTDSTLRRARVAFQALASVPDTALKSARAQLGRRLFFDPRISLDGTVSCARCHQPALYGTDGLAFPRGVENRLNPRNAPTVLNASLQFVEHWRGDRTSVEDQATRALVGPVSFGLPNYDTAVARLETLGYRSAFAAAFSGDSHPVSAANWGRAIGAYERTLTTPAPFDAYLRGNTAALGARARAGLATFMAVGCGGCHNGVGVGGGRYAKFGLTKPYWVETGSATIDSGRFAVTRDSDDIFVFKVPSLRNVAMTPPYFHDGSVVSLPAAVRVMGRVQLGRELSDTEIGGIVAFLESLTGPLPEDFARTPVLGRAPAAGHL
ncbi:MAG TPA: cytochrome c peroxidase [Gemmatimonadales bacterium]|nr:cytochrome c peroxidase [Gemmatimonadales bacterium]